MKKALPLFRICWFFWLNCCGHDNSSGVCVDDLSFTSIFESDSESGFDSLSLISATNDCFERHSSVLCQGILWKSHLLALDQVLGDPWSSLTYFGTSTACRRWSTRRSRDHGISAPFWVLFGIWDYVTGMGMSAHGFTHV
jgi:hypothetical protein